MATASLDVDAQKCFTPLCPQELPVPEGHLIIEELNQQALLADFRIGSKDAHSPNSIWVATETKPQYTTLEGKNVDMYWNLHAVPGTAGFELLEDLPHPTDYDYFVWKGIEPDMHPYGCCYHDLAEKLSTGVIEFLTVNKIDTVIVGGLALDYCVKTSALQLRRAGFNVLLNLAACRATSTKRIPNTIAEMKKAGIKIVDNASQLTAEL
jgi:nicotinamidase/pyrazinamidase